MRVIAESTESEMVACFLAGELPSERFGPALREAMGAAGLSEQLVTDPDLTDRRANDARRSLLGTTRGYGEDRELFDGGFPSTVPWVWARLTPDELSRVRYIDYSYWNELSDGSRLPSVAAERIRAGVGAFGVANDRFLRAATALTRGESFPPLILAGTTSESLVCLEGHLRLTAHALAGFPDTLTCLVGTSTALARWAH